MLLGACSSNDSEPVTRAGPDQAGTEASDDGSDKAASLAERIGKDLEQSTGIVMKVTCPALTKDTEFSCSVEAGSGERFAIDIASAGTAPQPPNAAAASAASGRIDGWRWQTREVAFGKRLAGQIRAFYAAEHQLELGDILCPAVVVGPPGTRAQCTARTRGVAVVFEVTRERDRDRYEPQRGLVVAALAGKLAIEEYAKQGVEIEVECDFSLRVSVPGETFTCTAHTAAGERAPLYYRIVDEDGGIRVQNRPFKP